MVEVTVRLKKENCNIWIYESIVKNDNCLNGMFEVLGCLFFVTLSGAKFKKILM